MGPAGFLLTSSLCGSHHAPKSNRTLVASLLKQVGRGKLKPCCCSFHWLPSTATDSWFWSELSVLIAFVVHVCTYRTLTCLISCPHDHTTACSSYFSFCPPVLMILSIATRSKLHCKPTGWRDPSPAAHPALGAAWDLLCHKGKSAFSQQGVIHNRKKVQLNPNFLVVLGLWLLNLWDKTLWLVSWGKSMKHLQLLNRFILFVQ